MRGYKQWELADKTGCSPSYISMIEKPPSRRGAIPSEDILKAIAAALSDTDEERLDIERKLLVARAKEKVVPESVRLAGDLRKRGAIGEAMPPDFVAKLLSDFSGVRSKAMFYKTLTIERDLFEKTLKGEAGLSRQQVIEIASTLGQDIGEYLLLANYLPDEVKKLASKHGAARLFRTLGDISPEDIDNVIDILDSVVRYRKKGHGQQD